MKIGILTSSRADFGIYLPLLEKLKSDKFFELEIIAFGTHLSNFHGKTLQEIKTKGFFYIREVPSLMLSDDPESIATTYGLTVTKFSSFWAQHQYKLVFALGDRFEMSAAVQASIPFGIEIAHIHGGETTLGAIDNIYRHQITLASKYHFTSTHLYSGKVADLTGYKKNIWHVGSLSLQNLDISKIKSEPELRQKFNLPDGKFSLVTFHPETVAAERNVKYARIAADSLLELSKDISIVITMPNADTAGTYFRQEFLKIQQASEGKICCVESFGKDFYFSAMKHAAFMIGNTSSGIIEAASFGKYAINVGQRQEGRARSENVIDISYNKHEIVSTAKEVFEKGAYKGGNIYFKEGAVESVIEVLKEIKNNNEKF